jgi:hypothetical protein
MVEGAAYAPVLDDSGARWNQWIWLRVCNSKMEQMAARAERLPATWRSDDGHDASGPDGISVSFKPP